MKYDFGGYVTKNDLKCADGRVIRHGAFKDCDGQTVPLVWQHDHTSVENVLGHALLENRDDGVYGYCSFNDTERAANAKEMVKHGDIVSLSIYANQLKQSGSDVLHGVIREVSLVLAGANPGAMIDNLCFAHGDSIETVEDEAVIYTGLSLQHSDDSKPDKKEEDVEDDKKEKKEEKEEKDKTVGDVLNTLNDEQKVAVGYIISQIEKHSDSSNEAKHYIPEEEDTMKHNVFEGDAIENNNVLTHSDVENIFKDAKTIGSLREAFLQNDAVIEHGITDIDVFYPEVKAVGNEPALISRDMAWVSSVLSGVRKSPFSRIKSTAANLTADAARAKGYIKGHKKIEEQISAFKRKTTPQTIYKLQKLDRDDVIDITDFDVVAWIKGEMRVMLNEEVARAYLIGDGRSDTDEDKIDPLNIRPIWGDDDTYTIYQTVAGANEKEKATNFIDEAVRARIQYRGSGSPTLYVGPSLLTEMLLLKDSQGYRLYKTEQELANALRVTEIVEVELLDNQVRTDKSGNAHKLGGLIVNLNDYTVGAARGGEVTLFDDFDIDYNKYEYLIETRQSGALTVPYSAIALEFDTTAPSTTDGENTGGETTGDDQHNG